MAVEPEVSTRRQEPAKGGTSDAVKPAPEATRRRETTMFLLLAIVVWPFIAVGVVAGWGLAVWIYYMLTGPPGPV